MSDNNTVRVGLAGPIAVVGALVLIGGSLWFLSTGMGGLSEDLVYYWSPKQLTENAAANPDATVRLGGQVEPGTVHFDIDTNVLTFSVTDGVATVPVRCTGAPPQMFREGIGVVVEGSLDGHGVFETDRVMVKHNNEYRAPEPGEAASDVYRSLMADES
jgi:cytochrome c-type biogenesis protein CcmE